MPGAGYSFRTFTPDPRRQIAAVEGIARAAGIDRGEDFFGREDRTGNKVNHLRGVTPEGKIYTLARLNAETELAGACFSPNGKVLFANAYSPGRTLAISGPWRSLTV